MKNPAEMARSLASLYVPHSAAIDLPKELAAFEADPTEATFSAMMAAARPDLYAGDENENAAQMWRFLSGESADSVLRAARLFNKALFESLRESVAEEQSDTDNFSAPEDGYSQSQEENVLLPLLARSMRESKDFEVVPESFQLLRILSFTDLHLMHLPVRSALAGIAIEGIPAVNSQGEEVPCPLQDALEIEFDPRDKKDAKIIRALKLANMVHIRPQVRNRDEQISEFIGALGYESLWDFAVAVDMASMSALMRIDQNSYLSAPLLGATHLFREEWLESFGVQTEQLNGFITSRNILQTVKNIFASAGIVFEAPDGSDFKITQLPLDAYLPAARQGVSPVGAVVDSGKDPKIFLKHLDGWEALRVALHESAHALHISRSPSFEGSAISMSSDHSFMEGVAYLFEGLFMDPLFIKKTVGDLSSSTGVSSPDDASLHSMIVGSVRDDLFYMAEEGSNTLYGAAYFGKKTKELLYQRAFHGAEIENLDDAHAMLHTYFRQRFGLHNSDLLSEAAPAFTQPDFPQVRYLRARLFGGTMEGALRRKFGREWFEDERAGRFIEDNLLKRWRYDSIEAVEKQIAGPSGYDDAAFTHLLHSRVLESGLAFVAPHLTRESLGRALAGAPVMTGLGPMNSAQVYESIQTLNSSGWDMYALSSLMPTGSISQQLANAAHISLYAFLSPQVVGLAMACS